MTEQADANPGTPGSGAEEVPGGGALRLGGLALRNGLLIHGPTHWAAAVRGSDGEIAVASEPKPHLAPDLAAKAPLVRGPLKLAEAMAVLPLVRRRLPEARLPFEDWRVIAAVGGALAASGLIRRRGPATPARETALQALGLIPALVALSDRNLAAYHGVEHKSIAAYEQGSEDAGAASKEHDRCGSHLVAPMLASTAVAVEVFAWCERNAETRTAKALRRPGFEIQRIVGTREPDERQLEVGRAALTEILRVETSNENS